MLRTPFCRRVVAIMAGSALAILLPAGPVQAGVVSFVITLDGDQATPSVTTTAGGTGTVTLDTGSNLFSWNITYQDLSGPLTAAHFHGPAPICEPAGVEVTISNGGAASGVIQGSATISALEAADLLVGLWYVNLHTALNPGGEIRGQVAPEPLGDPLPHVRFTPESGHCLRLGLFSCFPCPSCPPLP